MMDWEPWLEHDGSGPIVHYRCRIQCEFEGPGIRPIDGATISASWPGLYWNWKKVKTGWFRSKMRRVCDDPAYAPLIRYRILRPRGLAVLRHIAANPDAPIVAPELERAGV